MKRLLSLLLALCLLPAAAMAEPVQYEQILALRERIAQMRAELAEKESELEELEKLYKIQNANRRLVFEQDTWTLMNGRHMLLKPEIVRVKDDAPTKTELRWESSDPSIVWIDREIGRAYAKAPGEVEITCWALDDPDVFATITMYVLEPVESIRVSESEILLYVRGSGGIFERGTHWFGATVKPENASDKRLQWTSEDESVVQIIGESILRAENVGKTTVTAEAMDGSGKRATITVTVVKGIEAMVLNYTEATVTAGKKLRLSAEIQPADAGEQKLVWTSSDESVATVTTKGVVYAEKPGVCTITATATDGTGVTAECVVTVVK